MQRHNRSIRSVADRFATLGPENDRLMSPVAYVDLDATPLAGFKLVIVSAAAPVALAQKPRG